MDFSSLQLVREATHKHLPLLCLSTLGSTLKREGGKPGFIVLLIYQKELNQSSS